MRAFVDFLLTSTAKIGPLAKTNHQLLTPNQSRLEQPASLLWIVDESIAVAFLEELRILGMIEIQVHANLVIELV